MTSEQEAGWRYPAEMERLWDEQEGSGAPRAGLSLMGIVDGAVDLADAEGLGGITMAKLASSLGFTTMALYRHVPNKAALVNLMMDAGVGRPPVVADSAEGWRAQLELLSRAMAAVYRDHPWLMDVPISGPPATPNNLRWMEAGLAALRETPLEVMDKISVWLLLTGYVRGKQQLVLELTRGGRLGPTGQEIEGPSFGEMLRSRLDPAAFPEVLAALDDPGFNNPTLDDDEELDFEFGLQRVLDGIEVYIASRT